MSFAREFSRKMSSEIRGSVYVHWPYCRRRCTYCNFNKYLAKNVDEARMTKCLAIEATNLLRFSGFSGVSSIFFGGGTPSLMSPSSVESVIRAVRNNRGADDECEITLEANPGDLTDEKTVENLAVAGINRISLGIQCFDEDADLRLLNRDHSHRESLKAVAAALTAFPEATNVDLIFARPKQTISSWKRELESLFRVFPEIPHLSLYELTLERGTKLFHQVEKGHLELPDEDSKAEMYETAVEMLNDRGLRRYEVSNFAKKGSECRHNLNYWNGGEYVGVGPGAHGRFVPRNAVNADYRNRRAVDLIMNRVKSDAVDALNDKKQRQARIQTLEPIPWMNEVEKVGHGTRKIAALSGKDAILERISVGLRTAKGVKLTENCIHHFMRDSKLQSFIKSGLIILRDDEIMLSSSGLQLANYLTPFIINSFEKLSPI